MTDTKGKLAYYHPDHELKATGMLHLEHIELAKRFALLMLGAGGIFAIASGALVLSIQVAAPLWIALPVAIGFCFSAIVSIAVVGALTRGRRALVWILEEWADWQETARTIARESLWIETNIHVSGQGNTVSLNHANQDQTITQADNKQFVYVQNAPQLIDGIDVRDWVYFIDRIVTQVGFTKRAWLGTVMPSGWKIATWDDYAKLIGPLERARLLTGRGERSAGMLTITDPNRIKATLGLPRVAKDITPRPEDTPAAWRTIEAKADPDPDQDQAEGPK